MVILIESYFPDNTWMISYCNILRFYKDSKDTLFENDLKCNKSPKYDSLYLQINPCNDYYKHITK